MALIGYDLLGLAHPKFDLKVVQNNVPPGSAIGVFDDPFGPVRDKLSRLVSGGNYPVVRIQLHWDTRHRPIPLEKLKDKLPAWERFAQTHKGVKVYLSHSCEYACKTLKEVQDRVKLIRRIAPSCTPVNSVMSGPTMPDVITERHGFKDHNGHKIIVGRGDIASLDGESAYDGDVETWKKDNSQAAIQFLWGLRFNLNEVRNDGEPPVPPMDRTAAPSADYMLSVVRLGSDIGKALVADFDGAIKVKAPLLWKTHAEDSPGPNSRDNKPLFICDEKARDLTIIGWNGKQIGKLVYYGPFGKGLHRYYSGLPGAIDQYGYRIARKAFMLTDSEWVWLKVGKKIYGPVHPAFRVGYFQQ